MMAVADTRWNSVWGFLYPRHLSRFFFGTICWCCRYDHSDTHHNSVQDVFLYPRRLSRFDPQTWQDIQNDWSCGGEDDSLCSVFLDLTASSLHGTLTRGCPLGAWQPARYYYYVRRCPNAWKHFSNKYIRIESISWFGMMYVVATHLCWRSRHEMLLESIGWSAL